MKTKIVATIGPASAKKECLKKMVLAGMNVCRMNFSHGTHEDHSKVINSIREINKELQTHVALLADLQGPKIRVGDIKEPGIPLKNGDEIVFTTKAGCKTDKHIYISYQKFPQDVKKNEKVLVDDGKIVLQVTSTNQKDEVKLKVVQGGVLKSHKGVNLPNTKVSLPSLTEKDINDLKFILQNKVQWIALSFVRSADDIIELRHMMSSIGPKKKLPKIIAKIEKPEAIDDIDNIIKITDGIMVARGDLGIEMPLERVPLLQKMLVKKCLLASKPIIVATQMMEGMISNINPTRAEVSDVANSVMDGADALMLSGETSVGAFPVEVIETMQRIIKQVESYENIYYKHTEPDINDTDRFISNSIMFNACDLAQQVDAKAIISMTHSGYSAFKIASQRPKANIFIFTNTHSLLSTLSLVWGVQGFYYDKFISTDHTIEDIKHFLQKHGYLSKGDFVINIASTPIDELGKTNMLKLSCV